MVLDIQQSLLEKSHDYKEGSKEKKFVQQMTESLQSVSSVTDLISKILSTAKSFGLGLDDLYKFFT